MVKREKDFFLCFAICRVFFKKLKWFYSYTLTPDFAVTHIKDKTWYKENIKNKAGFRDVSRHIDTRKTKRLLDIKGAGKLKVFVMMSDNPDFDDRVNPSIVYKYAVCGGGEDDYCPQGTAYVIFYENKKKPKKK